MGYEGKLYVFGGCGAKGRMHDLYAFDVKEGTWEALPGKEEMKVRGEEGREEGGEGGQQSLFTFRHLVASPDILPSLPPSLPLSLFSGPRWRGSHGSRREDSDAGWLCRRRDEGHVGV